jgi:DNA-binding NtrC family response regulator/pSer/pThr/pTyr-binding forkhead associated (FHA) protein
MLTLAIDTGDGSELRYDLAKDTVSIGASGTNDVVLRSPGVAPVHVVIRRTGDSLTFIGQPRQIVLLNSEKRSRGVLSEGDRLRIGTATVIIVDEAGGMTETDLSEEAVEPPRESEAETETKAAVEDAAPRAEVVLYNEPSRLAQARRRLLEVFRAGLHTDLVEQLRAFFGDVFPGRGSFLAWLDQQGKLQPIVSSWTGVVPQLPGRTFAELERGDRIAVLRGGRQEVLIYPVVVGGADSRVYLLAETTEETSDEDRTLLAEIAAMIAVHWDRVEGSSALLGGWEAESRTTLESRLPGTSQAVRELRERILAASRSSDPVLISGRAGSGRCYLASLIASLRPTGKPWIRVLQARGGDESQLREELFGSGTTVGARELAARAGVVVVIVLSIERMSIALQSELASVMAEDLGAGYGSKVRWILTGAEGCEAMAAEGTVDHDLFSHVGDHLIRVPNLEERREDLPLIIVRTLETVGSEQGKEIRGISLETLDSLLGYSFEGQMTELLTELRRLVSATPEGELVRGSLRRATIHRGEVSGPEGDDVDATAVLGEDDLKVVIPAVEKLLIDRVLRRSLGNQSKAARELNLSRGALIAKIKEYGIPDYRSLRRSKR